jgi:hypothetical protein
MQPPRLKISLFLLAVSVSLAWASADASAKDAQRQILGINFKLAKDDVHKRLNEIGTFVRAERKSQEIWQVRDPSFSHLIVSFGKDGTLRFVTAVAREDAEAKRVPYAEMGNLDKARQAGDPSIKNFNYEWNLHSQNGSPRMLANARGRDPKFLTTYSLKKVDEGPVEVSKPAR